MSSRSRGHTPSMRGLRVVAVTPPAGASSNARSSRTARTLDEREGVGVDALASGDLDRFWSQALQNLKRHFEDPV